MFVGIDFFEVVLVNLFIVFVSYYDYVVGFKVVFYIFVWYYYEIIFFDLVVGGFVLDVYIIYKVVWNLGKFYL